MIFPDSYLTIADKSTAEYKEKGSRFISFALPIKTEEEAKQEIKNLRKIHYAAAHVCWAYVLGCRGEEERSSDDREPAGTAGRPILRAIQEKNLTYTLLVVVRYFGGKLLGVPGLISAYGESARLAVEATSIEEKTVYHRIFQPCSYDQQHEIIRILKHHQVKFFPDIQETLSGITFEVRPSIKDPILQSFLNNGFEPYNEIEILF